MFLIIESPKDGTLLILAAISTAIITVAVFSVVLSRDGPFSYLKTGVAELEAKFWERQENIAEVVFKL